MTFVRLADEGVFGPTIQGEGTRIGTVCHFVRLQGCDGSCSWCDTAYAKEPEGGVTRSVRSVCEEVNSLCCGQERQVVITGGNPCLQEACGDLVAGLHDCGWHVSLETQASIYRRWLSSVDHLTVSPKPPSSGMPLDLDALDRILHTWRNERGPSQTAELKVVVFNRADFEFATRLDRRYGHTVPLVLSVGTPGEETSLEDTVANLRDVVRWATAKGLPEVRVLPQLHAMMWGGQRGR